MLTWLIANYKLALSVIGLIAVLSLFGLVYNKGYNRASEKCKSEALKSEVKAIDDHKEIKRKVYKVPTHELDARLAQWVRD